MKNRSRKRLHTGFGIINAVAEGWSFVNFPNKLCIISYIVSCSHVNPSVERCFFQNESICLSASLKNTSDSRRYTEWDNFFIFHALILESAERTQRKHIFFHLNFESYHPCKNFNFNNVKLERCIQSWKTYNIVRDDKLPQNGQSKEKKKKMIYRVSGEKYLVPLIQSKYYLIVQHDIVDIHLLRICNLYG